MFVIHKMSSNFSFFSTSLRTFSKPLISSKFKHCFSVSTKLPTKKLNSFAFYSSNNHGFCTSAAVASPESTQIVTSDDTNDKNLKVGNLSELRIKLPTNDSSDSLLRIRHTCAHVMAMAVQKLYPNAKVTIGPWIDNGFYYDFDMDPITDKDLKRIKKEMERIIGRKFPLVREEVSRDEAHRRIAAQNEPYKLEILDSIKEEPITIYHIGLMADWQFVIHDTTSYQGGRYSKFWILWNI